ncbi:hypothetical protein ACIHCQ_00385 [Streptomyces sp. NPDC052236]|uniref:hypothetical protein n=1 Tax=Streptomyces sp. NPDC052236 TaxID=3365686 RepID=UPI0037D2A5E1
MPVRAGTGARVMLPTEFVDRVEHMDELRSLLTALTAPLERRLEIAHHLRLGGPGCLAASADAHYALAREAAMEGLSFAEAEGHCEEVIKAVRELPAHAEGGDRRFVQAVELLLSLTEVRWRGRHRPAGGPDIDALAAEAEAAASRCGEPGLVLRTTLLRGKTLG